MPTLTESVVEPVQISPSWFRNIVPFAKTKPTTTWTVRDNKYLPTYNVCRCPNESSCIINCFVKPECVSEISPNTIMFARICITRQYRVVVHGWLWPGSRGDGMHAIVCSPSVHLGENLVELPRVHDNSVIALHVMSRIKVVQFSLSPTTHCQEDRRYSYVTLKTVLRTTELKLGMHKLLPIWSGRITLSCHTTTTTCYIYIIST